MFFDSSFTVGLYVANLLTLLEFLPILPKGKFNYYLVWDILLWLVLLTDFVVYAVLDALFLCKTYKTYLLYWFIFDFYKVLSILQKFNKAFHLGLREAILKKPNFLSEYIFCLTTAEIYLAIILSAYFLFLFKVSLNKLD